MINEPPMDRNSFTPPHAPQSIIELAGVTNFRIDTSSIMRAQAYYFYQLDAELVVTWLPHQHTYRVEAMPSNINCVEGWPCPGTLLDVIQAFISRLLTLRGFSHCAHTNDIHDEARAGVGFTCHYKGQVETPPDWSTPVRFSSTSSPWACDLLHAGLAG